MVGLFFRKVCCVLSSITGTAGSCLYFNLCCHEPTRTTTARAKTIKTIQLQEDEAQAASYEESRNRGGTKALKQLSIAKERHGGAAARDGDEPPYGPAAAATLRELAPVDVDAEAVAAGKAGSPRPAFDSQTSNGSLRDGGKSLTRVSSASDVASPHTRLHCGGTVFHATAESVPSQPGSTLKVRARPLTRHIVLYLQLVQGHKFCEQRLSTASCPPPLHHT